MTGFAGRVPPELRQRRAVGQIRVEDVQRQANLWRGHALCSAAHARVPKYVECEVDLCRIGASHCGTSAEQIQPHNGAEGLTVNVPKFTERLGGSVIGR